ncbi:hypothetical protein ACHAWF_018398 [Thalassiosira exigua]
MADSGKKEEKNVESHQNIDGPPTPWGESSAKQKIINELKDETSDIHLFVGQHDAADFKNVNFNQILKRYAGNKYKMSLFRENMKRLLRHHRNKTGPFKAKKVERWYTSAKDTSVAYSLLYSLYMNPNEFKILNGLSVEQIWKSHPQFQLYELGNFKKYNENMKALTSKRKAMINAEEASFRRDMQKLSSNIKTSRGIPYWHTHSASTLLKKHVADEMNGTEATIKPQKLWESRTEYQQFPLREFRKHIYQERTKQLAAPYWQHKRNKNALKKYEQTEELLREWNQEQINRQVHDLVDGWGKINLDNV